MIYSIRSIQSMFYQQKSLPYLVLWLGFAIVFFFSASSFLRSGAPFGGDLSSHLLAIQSVSNSLKQGSTDFFVESSNLGVPLFLSYQPLGTLLLGGLHFCLGGSVSVFFLLKLSLLLLWCFIPFAWYLGGRGLGLSPLASFVLGMSIIWLEDSYFVGICFQSAVYKGLYAQQWGILFLPLFLGSWVAFFCGKKSWAVPFLFLTLTFLSHAFYGMLGCFFAFLYLLSSPTQWKKELPWAFLIAFVSLVCIGFWLIPLLQHKQHVGGLPWKGMIQNGWGWKSLGLRVWGGDFWDASRAWILTPLVFLAWIFCFFRWKERLHRWCLLLFFFSVIMLGGRTEWGFLYDWIPLHKEINVSRYIAGLQISGILALALWVSLLEKAWNSRIQRKIRTILSNIWFVVCGVVLFLFLTDRAQTMANRTQQMVFQKNLPFLRLVQQLNQKPSFRYLVGEKWGTHNHFYRDLVSVLSKQSGVLSYGMTFHSTLGAYYTKEITFTKDFFSWFGIRYVISHATQPLPSFLTLGWQGDKLYVLPRTTEPLPSFLTLAWQEDTLYLWEAKTTNSWFQWFTPSALLQGDLKKMRPWIRQHLHKWFQQSELPLLSSRKTKSPKGFVVLPLDPHKKPSAEDSVSSRFWDEKKGLASYFLQVDVAKNEQWLALKVNYHPFWKATLGDKKHRIFHVAPNFMAVALPKGRHTLAFRYQIPMLWKIYFLCSMVFLWGIVLWQVFRKTER